MEVARVKTNTANDEFFSLEIVSNRCPAKCGVLEFDLSLEEEIWPRLFLPVISRFFLSVSSFALSSP